LWLRRGKLSVVRLLEQNLFLVDRIRCVASEDNKMNVVSSSSGYLDQVYVTTFLPSGVVKKKNNPWSIVQCARWRNEL
jgi:hypothetical protein